MKNVHRRAYLKLLDEDIAAIIGKYTVFDSNCTIARSQENSAKMAPIAFQVENVVVGLIDLCLVSNFYGIFHENRESYLYESYLAYNLNYRWNAL